MSHDGSSGEGAEPPQGSLTTEERARLRFSVVSATALIAVAAAVAWFVPVHPGDDLGPTGAVGYCVTRDGDATERDAVLGAGGIRVPRDVWITSVRLVDPVNVALADAIVVPIVEGPDGGYSIFGAQTGWPLTEEQRAGLTLDWPAERLAVGAHLVPGVEVTIGLHVRVADTALDATYSGFQIEYRMAGATWVQTYPHRFLMPGGPASCPGVATSP